MFLFSLCETCESSGYFSFAPVKVSFSFRISAADNVSFDSVCLTSTTPSLYFPSMNLSQTSGCKQNETRTLFPTFSDRYKQKLPCHHEQLSRTRRNHRESCTERKCSSEFLALVPTRRSHSPAEDHSDSFTLFQILRSVKTRSIFCITELFFSGRLRNDKKKSKVPILSTTPSRGHYKEGCAIHSSVCQPAHRSIQLSCAIRL